MEENPAPVDRSLLIPLAIGVFAIVGICLVLFALRLSAAPGSIQLTATATPVKYVYLGTEPAIVQPTDQPTPTATEPTPTAFGLPTQILSATSLSTLVVSPGASTNTSAATNSTLTNATPSATKVAITATGATATFDPSTTYDDVDSIMAYTGNWVAQTGLANTYKNTLHISNAIGDAFQFTYYGDRFQFVYQGGPTLGTLVIHIATAGQDTTSADYTLEQVANITGGGQWESPILATAYHTVTITHISGGSINVDGLVLFTFPTPTPTITPTITRTVNP